LELEVKDAEKLPEKVEKAGFTAWGREVGGLQAGLGYPPGQHRTSYTGETEQARCVLSASDAGQGLGRPHLVASEGL
jgi:hypothetical protein